VFCLHLVDITGSLLKAAYIEYMVTAAVAPLYTQVWSDAVHKGAGSKTIVVID